MIAERRDDIGGASMSTSSRVQARIIHAEKARSSRSSRPWSSNGSVAERLMNTRERGENVEK